MEIDDLTDKVMRSPDRISQARDLADQAFQDRVLRRILLRLGREDMLRALRLTAKERTNSYQISELLFRAEVTSFPHWVACYRIPYLHKTSVPTFFNDFASTKIASAWAAAYDEAPDHEKPLSIISEWPGLKGRFIVLHDGRGMANDGETRICRYMSELKSNLWLERFEPWLEMMRSLWA